jgi:hypothetical protein
MACILEDLVFCLDWVVDMGWEVDFIVGGEVGFG